jgi:hypothetical protein
VPAPPIGAMEAAEFPLPMGAKRFCRPFRQFPDETRNGDTEAPGGFGCDLQSAPIQLSFRLSSATDGNGMHLRNSGWFETNAMFGIDWLRNGIPIEKETSVFAAESDVIAAARHRASNVAGRHPDREPDSFRLTDASGKILGVFPIKSRGPA